VYNKDMMKQTKKSFLRTERMTSYWSGVFFCGQNHDPILEGGSTV